MNDLIFSRLEVAFIFGMWLVWFIIGYFAGKYQKLKLIK
jgi:hypothetical protein